jgi:hypothetical protein
MSGDKYTPERLETSAPDSVVIGTLPSHEQAGCITTGCFDAGALVVAYYTGSVREGWFYACSVEHAAAQLALRALDLFPNVHRHAS